MTTPLPPVDPELVARFWERVVAAGVVEAGTPAPVVEVFGDSTELADELIGLVVGGPKRATAGSVDELAHAGEQVPEPGDLWIATDGARRPRALLRTTEVRIGPLSSVDDAFAWDEGEGDQSRAWWLDAHTRYFRRTLAAIGVDFDPGMATVFERFEVLFTESSVK